MATELRWWGDFTVAKGMTLRWQIGPTTLWVEHTQHDWQIAYLENEDPLDSRLVVAEPTGEVPGDDATMSRFALGDDGDTLRLLPTHANRPVIVSPEKPFYLPPGHEATLYIGTPLWVRVQAGSRFTELIDFPLFRPSDTWFGPNTLVGELCYATRTAARLHLENLPQRPHRAVSAARIRNRAKTKLLLEKLKLPVQHLSLFCSESGHLWTEALTLQRDDDTDQATVRLDKNPTDVVRKATFISAPREKVSRGFLIETFGGFFARKPEKKDERAPRQTPAPRGGDASTDD